MMVIILLAALAILAGGVYFLGDPLHGECPGCHRELELNNHHGIFPGEHRFCKFCGFEEDVWEQENDKWPR